MIVLSILFGLSMDYEVFLVSRIREEYVRTGDARGSVRTGVGAIGKVIVAAGLIMGSVFWAFVIGDDRTVKAFGVGLGVAILVDALLVRMVLVPAVMHLLGRHAWYIPRWLDRALPALTIEPPEHDGESERADEPADAEADQDLCPSADPRDQTAWPDGVQYVVWATRHRRGVPMKRFHDLLADEICEAELRAKALDRAGKPELADWWRGRAASLRRYLEHARLEQVGPSPGLSLVRRRRRQHAGEPVISWVREVMPSFG